MVKYIYRNYTIEYLFPNSDFQFSGYGDVSEPQEEIEEIIIFYQINPSSSPSNQVLEISDIKSKIDYILTNCKEKRVTIINLFRATQMDWEIKCPNLLCEIDSFNSVYLKEVVNKFGNVKIVDINNFHTNQIDSIIDWRFFFTSQMIINPKLSKQFNFWFNRKMESISLKRKKCLILDCDNTLWGGVVGEDGTNGIKLGVDYPGNCFKSFQNLLFELSKQGVILAICSKNNLSDVEDVWKNNINNIIDSNVVSAYRINWQDKASNIKSIAEELNIGLDSVVFFDDNPVERSLVKKILPEVEVPEFPDKPYQLIDFFWKTYENYFSVYELTDEDLKKSDQYKENFFRNESKRIFENLDDYLASLEIEIDIIRANDSNLTRISQMTQKTNQFNLTTKRYSEEQLRSMLNADAKIYCAHVRDKFGDNGITVASIMTIQDQANLYLDSHLLSCRILGREIEKVVLLKILNIVNPNNDKTINAEFIPTAKNGQVTNFLESIGFKLINTLENGTKKYIYDTSNKISIKDYYKISIK